MPSRVAALPQFGESVDAWSCTHGKPRRRRAAAPPIKALVTGYQALTVSFKTVTTWRYRSEQVFTTVRYKDTFAIWDTSGYTQDTCVHVPYPQGYIQDTSEYVRIIGGFQT